MNGKFFLLLFLIPVGVFSLPHPILTPEFQKEMNLITASEVVSGNSFELLVDSEVSLTKKIDMVRNAKKSILLSTMIFVTFLDTFTQEFSTALLEKAKQKVPVYIIIDELSSYLDAKLFKTLEKGGVQIIYFNPTFGNDSLPWDVRMHEKVLIVDDTKATIGGQNLYNERYPFFQKILPSNALNWRDTDLYVEGPLVQSMVNHFREMWNRISKKEMRSLASSSTSLGMTKGQARFLYNEPYCGQKFINHYYLKLIQSAQKEIIWQGNQVVLSKEFEWALKDAANRGVKVILMSNSFSTSWWQPGWYQYFFVKGYLPFRNSNVQLRLYKTRYNHSKIFYMDGIVVSVGSFNHDLFSLNNDAESTVAIYDPQVIAAIHRQILEDLKDTEELVFSF